MNVIFDQVRISDDGKKLYIDVHVNKADLFDNVYLDYIKIATSQQVLLETEVTTPPESNYVYYEQFEGNQKEIHLVLGAVDFNEGYTLNTLEGTLFFVYVVTKGTVGPCTPCRLDEATNLAVTFDENQLYMKIMQYTKSLGDDCSIPVGFTDFILLWNAFKASVETEHYIPAINYYNMLFDKSSVNALSNIDGSRGCGCRG